MGTWTQATSPKHVQLLALQTYSLPGAATAEKGQPGMSQDPWKTQVRFSPWLHPEGEEPVCVDV